MGALAVAELARFTPTLLLGIGVASALPIFVLHGHDSTGRTLGFGLGIILRVWIILYLMKPSILDVFLTKRADQVSVGSSVQ